MKIRDALEIICSVVPRTRTGFLVNFERVEGSILASDYFPDGNEEPIADEEAAWVLAREFAKRTVGTCVNIYVIHASNFTPVKGYEQRRIKNRAHND